MTAQLLRFPMINVQSGYRPGGLIDIVRGSRSFCLPPLKQLLYAVNTRLRHPLKQLPQALIIPWEQRALGLQCAVLELPVQQSQCCEAVSKGLVEVSAELRAI